jgi:hypothetical protein
VTFQNQNKIKKHINKQVMTTREAIRESSKGTATRREKDLLGQNITIIAYPDGTYFRIVAKNGKVLNALCGAPSERQYLGKLDWIPSK